MCSQRDQLQFNRESTWLAKTMKAYFGADKMNIAALGNQVTQLHLHHIARFKKDPAWPGAVWGKLAPQAYEPALSDKIIADFVAFAMQSFSANRSAWQKRPDLR